MVKPMGSFEHTGQNRTFPDIGLMAAKVRRGWRGNTGRFTPGRSLDSALSRGGIHLSKNRWPGLNAGGREEPKHDSPSTLKEFVA